MNYTDSVSSIKRKINIFSRYFLKRKLKRLYFDYIYQALEEIDFMLKYKEDNVIQIKKWKEIDQNKFKEHIFQFEASNKFLEANCHLLLLECDLRVAVYHITISDDDWEYRFFARRIYTLLYETQQTYARVAGEFKNEFEKLFEPEVLNSYINAKGKFDKFLKKHKDTFKTIRNKTEAHKSRIALEQKKTIEEISVKDSWQIIQEALILIQNMNINIINVYKAFSIKSAELLKKASNHMLDDIQ